MSKELEYIQRQIDIVKQQVKGSKMKIIVTDTFTKHKYDYYERELQTLESIEQALKRLESIDNANPSEALKCLEKIAKQIELDEDTDYWEIRNAHKTVENALIKAEKEHNSINLLMQELDCKDFADLRKYARCGYEKLNKQYLKWEDLEKFKDKDSVKVKMNDTELSLIIQIDCLNDIYVQLYKEKEDGNCINLLSDFFRNKELFNNLRLELLE